MTQASMLHVQGSRVDIDRVSKAVVAVHQSQLFLASLDAARQQMALQGEQLTLQLADDAKPESARLSVLQSAEMTLFVTLDRTRLTVTVSGLD